MLLDRTLKKAAACGRLAGAYLFLGPEEAGTFEAACEFARSLDCADTDIHIIEPEGAGDVIKINKIRELQGKVSLMPYEGKHRFAIIKKAHGMTEESSNAFLKLLEEPPLDTTIILTTSNMLKLLPTIISRCQIVRFHGVNPSGAKRSLPEGDEPQIPNPGFIDAFLRALDDETKDIGTENLSRKEQEEAIETLLGFFRDVLAYKVLGSEAGITFEGVQEALRRLANELSYEDMERSIAALNKAADSLKQNANSKLVFSVLMIELRGAACSR